MSRPSGPRIRTFKPERWHDERMAGVSRDARHLYDGLTTQADDEGRGTANLALIRANVLPFDSDATPKRIQEWLDELDRAKLITLYETDGRTHLAINSWAEDQRVDRPTPSRIPPPSTAAREEPTMPRDSSRGIDEPSRTLSPSRAPADRDQDQDQDQDHSEQSSPASPPVPLERAREKSERVQAVFDAWVTATQRPGDRTKLTPDRRRRIEKALTSHGLDDCLAAVRNIGADSWARGDNDRHRRFDDVEHALGSGERIERWRDHQPRTSAATPDFSKYDLAAGLS